MCPHFSPLSLLALLLLISDSNPRLYSYSHHSSEDNESWSWVWWHGVLVGFAVVGLVAVIVSVLLGRRRLRSGQSKFSNFDMAMDPLTDQ